MGLALAAALAVLPACFDVWGTYATGASSGAGGSDVDPASGGATPSSTSTSSPTTSGSGGGGVESCTDGTDDDGDGLIDCADIMDCSSYVCTAAAPSDAAWLGPALLRDAGDDRPCPPSYPTAGPEWVALAAPCKCACAAPTGETCRATVTTFSSGGCTGTALGATVEAGACGLHSASATTATATAEAHGGACTPSIGGGPSGGTDVLRRSCEGAAGAGCADGERCVRPAGPADGSICWYQDGDVACPSGLPLRTVLYSASAPPTCSSAACTCAPSANGACVGSLSIFDSTCASSTVASVPLTGACSAGLATSGAIQIASASVSTPGACAPAPVFPIGSLVGATRTYCCAPSL